MFVVVVLCLSVMRSEGTDVNNNFYFLNYVSRSRNSISILQGHFKKCCFAIIMTFLYFFIRWPQLAICLLASRAVFFPTLLVYHFSAYTQTFTSKPHYFVQCFFHRHYCLGPVVCIEHVSAAVVRGPAIAAVAATL